jgi:hypothetical protein
LTIRRLSLLPVSGGGAILQPSAMTQGFQVEGNEEMQAVVEALAAQLEALISQARASLGEARFAALAARVGQIRQEARRGINGKTLLEDKVWLDEKLAELIGRVSRPP